MPATQRKCIYGGLTLDVDRHYIGSVTATTHQEKGIITLESNPSRGTVLPFPHGKGNKCDKNVKYKRTDALSLWHQQQILNISQSICMRLAIDVNIKYFTGMKLDLQSGSHAIYIDRVIKVPIKVPTPGQLLSSSHDRTFSIA